MSIPDGKDRWLWSVTAVVGGLYAAPLWLAPFRPLAVSEWQSSLYRQALQDHFWQYLAYTPLKPPLFSVLHAAALWLADGVGVEQVLLLRVLAALTLVLVAPLCYLAAREIGARAWVAAPMAALAALTLLPLAEQPMHYDLPVFPLLAWFAWSTIRVLRREGHGGFVPLSLSITALVAQSTVQAGVVAVAVAAGMALAVRPGQRFKAALKTALAFVPAGLLLVALVVKNLAAVGVAANSTLGGHTMMLFTMANNQWDVADTRRHAQAVQAPDWYLWCYDNPQPPPGAEQHAAFWRTLGFCFPANDMEPLADRLAKMDAKEQEAAVRRDMARIQNRPWLLSGVSPDMATEWFAVYGSWSAKVSAHAFHEDPVRWLMTGLYIHGNLFANIRHDYIASLLDLDHAGESYRSWPVAGMVASASYGFRLTVYRLLPYVLLFLALIWGARVSRGSHGQAAVMTGLALAVSFLLMPRLLWGFQYGLPSGLYSLPLYVVTLTPLGLLWWSRRGGEKSWGTRVLAAIAVRRGTIAGMVFLAVQLLMTAAIYCLVVGTENNRFFIQLLPELMVMGAIVLSGPAVLFQRIRHARDTVVQK